MVHGAVSNHIKKTVGCVKENRICTFTVAFFRFKSYTTVSNRLLKRDTRKHYLHSKHTTTSYLLLNFSTVKIAFSCALWVQLLTLHSKMVIIVCFKYMKTHYVNRMKHLFCFPRSSQRRKWKVMANTVVLPFLRFHFPRFPLLTVHCSGKADGSPSDVLSEGQW